MRTEPLRRGRTNSCSAARRCIAVRGSAPGAGYAVLAIDWCFGERCEQQCAMVKRLLWDLPLWGYRQTHSLRSLGVFTSGFAPSGSYLRALWAHDGQWAAALDARIDACIDLLSGRIRRARCQRQLRSAWRVLLFLACAVNSRRNQRVDCARAHLSLVGKHDPLTPQMALPRLIVQCILPMAFNQSTHWRQTIYDGGHQADHARGGTRAKGNTLNSFLARATSVRRLQPIFYKSTCDVSSCNDHGR